MSLPILAQVTKETGDQIMILQSSIVEKKQWTIKTDSSPVTEADKLGHRLIVERLKEHFPGIPVVSEEGDPEANQAALQSDDRFAIDPMDNTSRFIKGRDGFSVNIGRIKDGKAVAGAIYFPAKRELYFTGDDGSAYAVIGDAPPREIHVAPLKAPIRVAVGYNDQQILFFGGREQVVKKYPSQYRACMVANGTCDITSLQKGGKGGFESWDITASHAILNAAGGMFITDSGTELLYGKTTTLPNHIAISRQAWEALLNLPRPWTTVDISNGLKDATESSSKQDYSKVLFLDIDGVLNTPQDCLHSNPDDCLTLRLLAKLDRFVQETGCAVVVSSTWRLRHTVESLQRVFTQHGFSSIKSIVDFTPYLEFRSPGDPMIDRGYEVEQWLKEHPEVSHFGRYSRYASFIRSFSFS